MTTQPKSSGARKVLRFLGRWIGYPTFFVGCFLLFAYLTFPYDRVRDFVIYEVENPQGRGGRAPSGYQLEIADLSPSWFTGVEATGVRLVKLAETPEEESTEVTFEYVRARISLLSLLLGSQDITFATRVGGGTIEGAIELDGTERSLDVTFDGVRLQRVGLLRGMMGLPISGQISGTVVGELFEDAALNTGEIDLHLAELTLGDGSAKLRFDANAFTRAGLTIPETQFGDVDLEGTLADGNAQITQLQSRGEHIQLDGTGSVRVRGTVMASTIDMMLRIGISESYRSDNEGLFMVLDQVPRVAAAKTPDEEALQFHLSGNIGPRLRFQGAGRSPRPGSE